MNIKLAGFSKLITCAAMISMVVGTAGVVSRPAVAQDSALTPEQSAKIDEIGRLSVEGAAAPGVTIGVARGTQIVYLKGFGKSNVEDDVAASGDTRYPIGSNTKQFTAASILMLQDRGLLNINDRLSKYLPEIPHADKVTIRELMTHAGGYAEYTEREDFDEVGNRPATLAQIVGTVDARPLSFTPGTKREYSNTGYALLTMLIERVSKMSYAQFLQRNIFEPLGMSSTYVRTYSDAKPNVATEYESFALGSWEHALPIDYTWFTGAGSVVSNAQDLVKWNAGLPTLLSKRSLTEMLTPIDIGTTFPGYALGIAINKLPSGHRIISHGGNTTGAATQDARFPDDNLSIIVLANSGTFSYDPAVMAIYGVLVPSESAAKPQEKTAAKAHHPDANPQMVAQGERWLDQAIAGSVDMQSLRPDFRARLSPQHRTEIEALGALGPRQYTVLTTDRRPPMSSIGYLVKTPKKSFVYYFGRDDNGQVAAALFVDTVDYSKL